MIRLICYDISNNGQRARLHRFLKEHGLNTQKSVFECDIDAQRARHILERARDLMTPETDSVRMYGICRSCARRVMIHGRGIMVLEHDWEVL